MDLNNDYDPHAERATVVKKPLKTYEALVHILKGCLGTGVLGLPYAYNNSGWANGLIFTVLISALSFYAIRIVVNDMYLLCKSAKVPFMPYPEAMEYSFQIGHPKLTWFAKPASYMTRFFLALKHFGTCVAYVLFVSRNLQGAMKDYDIELDNRIIIAALFVPVCLLFFIRYLKMMTPISLIANILLLTGYFCIMYYFFVKLPPFHERVAFKSFEFLPSFYGTVLFAATSVGVILTVEGEMKNPKHFMHYFGILNIAAVIVVGFYCFFSFFGYWQYGEAVQNPVTLNLPVNPLRTVVLVFVATAIFLSYAIQAYVAHNMIWPIWIKPRFKEENADKWEFLFRFIFVVISVALAVAVMNLDAFMSFAGALCVSFLLLIFPAMMDLCIKYHTGYGVIKLYFIRDVFFIIFGLAGAGAGMYYSTLGIIKSYQNPDK